MTGESKPSGKSDVLINPDFDQTTSNFPPNFEPQDAPEIRNARLAALDRAQAAIDTAFTTGKADRAKITRLAQLDAAEAVAMAGIAMESDIEADEAARLTVIAEEVNDREASKKARLQERTARKRSNIDHKEATKAAKRAYDAIRFSAPNQMGFLRVVQILFGLQIAGTLLVLVLTSADIMVYNAANLFSWVTIILEGVAFWFFINRYRIARPFVIGMSAFGIIFPTVTSIIQGTLTPLSFIYDTAFFVFLIIYFATSKRVKATLVNNFSKRKGDFDRQYLIIDRRGWPFVRNLIIYYIVFSILGHWMEMGLCQFIILGWVEGEYNPADTVLWRDWLHPFTMEGMAVVIIALFLYPLWEWLQKKIKLPFLSYVVSFLINALLCAAIEFTMGLIMNSDLQMWDYSNNFGNIMGQVCLQNTLAFGAAASIITWWVYPLLAKLIARVPRDIMNIIFIVVLVFGGIVWSLYIFTPPQEIIDTTTGWMSAGQIANAHI